MQQPSSKTPFSSLPPAQQAGILCNDPRFQRFAAICIGYPADELSPSAAAEYVRLACGVNSRGVLNTNPAAAERFQALRTEFDAWTGRIAAPRP